MIKQRIFTPLNEETIAALHCGDMVLLCGVIYTARDIAHRRMVECIEQGRSLPFALEGQVIYYSGPTPPRPGKVIGAVGPTTAYRMDVFTPRLLSYGLKGMIGKDKREEIVRRALVRYKAIYFGAIGGTGAFLSQRVISSTVIAYEELGTEAIRRLEVKDFPLMVINDLYGEDLYQRGRERYKAPTED